MLISIQKMIDPLWIEVESESRHRFSVPGLMTCLAKPEAPKGGIFPSKSAVVGALCLHTPKIHNGIDSYLPPANRR
jgi:hypothetical protein